MASANCFKDLLDRYFFLLEADESGFLKLMKIPDGKVTIQLAAFGLFEYANWSWKRPKKALGRREFLRRTVEST